VVAVAVVVAKAVTIARAVARAWQGRGKSVARGVAMAVALADTAPPWWSPRVDVVAVEAAMWQGSLWRYRWRIWWR
jgi:hypothetical protein